MTYNLTSLNLPKINGRPLRLFAGAVDSPLRSPVVNQLLKQGGVTSLREKFFPDPPTFYPLALAEAAANRDAPPLEWDELQDEVGRRLNREPFASVADYARAYREHTTTPAAIAEARWSLRHTSGGAAVVRVTAPPTTSA